MNKSLFHGWRDIFSFTFKQGVNGPKFKNVTLTIAIVLFLAGMSISVIMAFVQKEDATETSPLEVVHVIDESNLQVLYLDGFIEANQEKYPKVSFRIGEGTVEEISKKIMEEADQETGSKDAVLHISETEEGYLMSLHLPEGSALTKNDGEEFLSKLTMVLEQSKLYSSNIPMENLVLVMSGINTTMLDAGEEEKSMGEELVGMLLPVVVVLFLYLMNAVYGQSIGNIVSVEKTSKLMEMILTMTKPYGLIFGKIFAMTCISIMQTLIWVGSFVLGFFVGHMMASEMIYTEYTNVILEVFELLKNQDGSTAFSWGALAIALFTVCISFLFYNVLAGLLASFAAKPETLAQVMNYYTFIISLGFIGAYVLPLEGNDTFNTLLRIFPVTSAYMLPGDIVVGNVTVAESILYVGILLAVTIVLVIASGKIYKNQIFYKGAGLKAVFMKKNKA